MLTPKRHKLISEVIQKQQLVTIQELVALTGASESTIRRDLSELEKQHLLVRIHGGATLKQSKSQELSYPEKSRQHIDSKKRIAYYASALIEENDCIYLDAGTTTYEMIPFLVDRNITVVTNGLTHVELLSQLNIKTYLLGGFVKNTTRALIGQGAQASLLQYRLDKCFLGVNGIHSDYAYTTPDPEEAIIKKTALKIAQNGFVVADASKLNQISFAKIDDLQAATIIINKPTEASLDLFEKKTNVKVVTEE
ncbi:MULTISPECIES: DeoR/GlpR family DNA-binding transcription regulator [Paraliobacillus]|uniref:DeoR/GlpR family DNA-binding transcription regulator n=1 Tax=Paraliobacillus TaxID=200903 RepID=UPI000DD41F6D|nr:MULTISPECIES: DeoR/GlpR family DNA-binding transcription regulator [Paraliobacillus]